MTEKFALVKLFWICGVLLPVSGCAPINQTAECHTNDLSIPDFYRSMGAEGEDFETGVYHYTVSLWNRSDKEVQISSIAPVLNARFEKRLISTETAQKTSRVIPPRKTIQVKGELHFDFEGLTKQDIENMGPVISGFKLFREDSLPVPGH